MAKEVKLEYRPSLFGTNLKDADDVEQILRLFVMFLKRNRMTQMMKTFFEGITRKYSFPNPTDLFIDCYHVYMFKMQQNGKDVPSACDTKALVLSQKWRFELLESDLLSKYEEQFARGKINVNGTYGDDGLKRLFKKYKIKTGKS